MKTTAIGVLLLQLATSAAAQSASSTATSPQGADDVQIVVGGFETAINGAEENHGIYHTIVPINPGKSFGAEWSMFDCGYLELSVAHKGFKDGATIGWNVEITPLRVVNRAVTFRLRWVRALDKSGRSFPPSEDLELTMRPGDERTLDRVPVPAGAKTMDGKPCGTSAASLRLSVANYPWDDVERRLIAADLWLVEKLANGTERSQTVAVRGLPNRAMPFYFDSIIDGQASLDILGTVIARPDGTSVGVTLQARSRVAEAPPKGNAGNWPMKWLESTLQLKPQETVEVPLPKLGKDGGPFGERTFAIRIRAREVR